MTSTTSRAGDPRAADFAARHFKWNAGLLVLEAVSFFAGLAFFDGTTVMPVLLRQLHASDQVIGLTRFIGVLGFTLPALFAAHYIHGRTRHKSFLLATCAVGRSGLLAIPVILLMLGASAPSAALVITLTVISIFWVLDGACAVSWFDIIAKTVPARVRGRFFGVMQGLGGLAALLAGVAVTAILKAGGLGFPRNFALLAALWCAGAAGSFMLLCLLREPHGRVDEEDKPTLLDFLRAAPSLLRRNPRVARLIMVRLLMDGAGVATPFYVIFARDSLGVPLSMVGVYAMVQSVGRLCTGPLWGWISDRFGPAAGVRAVGFSVLAIPWLGLGASAGAAWLFPAVFLLLGAVMDGVWMVSSSLLLETVTERERPLAVGVTSVFQTPSAFYGLAGGFLAQYTSFPTLFGVAAAFAAGGFGLAFTLKRKEGRDDDAMRR